MLYLTPYLQVYDTMAMHTWLLYLLAVIGLSLTPGPNGLLALTHGALYGHKKTLFTISGGVTGFVLIIALSMVGIGALLQTSASALAVLKWLGAGYLMYIGVQIWRSDPISLNLNDKPIDKTAKDLYRQGLLAAISNPKVLLFYGAFLPQFIAVDRPLLIQFIIMALTFGLVEFVVEALLARIAHRIRPWLNSVGKRFNHICGGVFIAIGLALPLTR